MTKNEEYAVDEFTEMNLQKGKKYTFNDMQDAFLIGYMKAEKNKDKEIAKIKEALQSVLNEFSKFNIG